MLSSNGAAFSLGLRLISSGRLFLIDPISPGRKSR
jgi:hypothetical protein